MPEAAHRQTGGSPDAVRLRMPTEEVQDAQNLGTAEFQCIDTDNNGGLYLAGYTSPVLFGSLNLDGNLIPSNPSTSQHIVVAKLGNYFPPWFIQGDYSAH